MQTQADADITNGASVLLVDAIDSGSGAAIEASAKAKGVAVIDYDRLTKGGASDRMYVSFDNVLVGKTDRSGRGLLHHGMEGEQAEHPDHGRRPRPTTTRRCSRRDTTACSSRTSTTAPT